MIFTFDQSAPGFTVLASLELSGANDTLAALPNLASCPGCTPADFGHLASFSLFSPVASYTLADFREPDLGSSFPEWSISPTRIDYIDMRNDFFINFATGHIQIDTDDAASPCGQTAECVAVGHWEPLFAVPAPPVMIPLALGIVAVPCARVLRRRSSKAA